MNHAHAVYSDQLTVYWNNISGSIDYIASIWGGGGGALELIDPRFPAYHFTFHKTSTTGNLRYLYLATYKFAFGR